MGDRSPAIDEFLLSIADDEHLMGQQHCEWIGVAPFLEEDLAFASIGQDELGHAAMLYELVADDADQLAFGRSSEEYRSCRLVELPCDDWALALVRHWMYDEAETLRWQLLEASADEAIASCAVLALTEERFHLAHARQLVDALVEQPDSRRRLADAAAALLPDALTMFTPVAGETEAIDRGIVSGSVADIVDTWAAAITNRLDLTIDRQSANGDGRTTRTEHFDTLMSRMREVIDLDPDARW